jgi:hypothetical protein
MNLRHLDIKVRIGASVKDDTNVLTPVGIQIDESMQSFAVCQVTFAPHSSLLKLPMGTPITVYEKEYNQFSKTSIEPTYKVIYFGFIFAHSLNVNPQTLGITFSAYTQAYFYDKTMINADDQGIQTFRNMAIFGLTSGKHKDGENSIDFINQKDKEASSDISGYMPLVYQLLKDLNSIDNKESNNPFSKAFSSLSEKNRAWIHWNGIYKFTSSFASYFINYKSIFNAAAISATIRQKLITISNGINLKDLMSFILNIANCTWFDSAAPMPGWTKNDSHKTTILKYDSTFLAPPPCNYIFPHQIISFNYSRNTGMEPTRGWMEPNPLDLSMTSEVGPISSNTTNSGVLAFLFLAPEYLNFSKSNDKASWLSTPLTKEEYERYIVPASIPGNMDYAEALWYVINPAYAGNVDKWLTDSAKTNPPVRAGLPEKSIVTGSFAVKQATNAENSDAFKFIQRYVNAVFYKAKYSARSLGLTISYNRNLITGESIVVFLPELELYLQGVLENKSHSLSTGSYLTNITISKIRPYKLVPLEKNKKEEALYPIDVNIKDIQENLFLPDDLRHAKDYFDDYSGKSTTVAGYINNTFPSAHSAWTSYGKDLVKAYGSSDVPNDFTIRAVYYSAYAQANNPDMPNNYLNTSDVLTQRAFYEKTEWDKYLNDIDGNVNYKVMDRSNSNPMISAGKLIKSILDEYNGFLSSKKQLVSVEKNLNG